MKKSIKSKLKLIFASLCLVLLIGGSTFFFIYFTHSEKQAKVVTTIFPIYDICREILGTEDDLVMLQDNGIDMHSFEPTAKDIRTISSAELFIHIGGESDEWVGDIIRSADNINLKKLSLMDIVTKVEESDEGILEGGHDHGNEEDEKEDVHHEHDDVAYDEHIWLSLKNAIVMTQSIKESLIMVYPERTELINQNAQKYIEKLMDLENEYKENCLSKDRTIVVADRFPFLYLAKDYDIKYMAAFSGCSAETEASAETLTKLIDKVNSENLKYICVLESSSRSIANQIKSNCAVDIVVLNSCQSVSSQQLSQISYYDLMKSNLEILKKVLN